MLFKKLIFHIQALMAILQEILLVHVYVYNVSKVTSLQSTCMYSINLIPLMIYQVFQNSSLLSDDEQL